MLGEIYEIIFGLKTFPLMKKGQRSVTNGATSQWFWNQIEPEWTMWINKKSFESSEDISCSSYGTCKSTPKKSGIL